jgi:hypothetical protein
MPATLYITGTTVAAGLFTGTISLGVALLTLIFLAVVGYFATKWKITELAQKQAEAANEAANTWRENYVAERTRADDMEKRYHEQRGLKHEALAKVAALELRTDQTIVLQALRTNQEALRNFHDEFLTREADASAVRSAVMETEERIVVQLTEIAHALEEFNSRDRTLRRPA